MTMYNLNTTGYLNTTLYIWTPIWIWLYEPVLSLMECWTTNKDSLIHRSRSTVLNYNSRISISDVNRQKCRDRDEDQNRRLEARTDNSRPKNSKYPSNWCRRRIIQHFSQESFKFKAN